MSVFRAFTAPYTILNRPSVPKFEKGMWNGAQYWICVTWWFLNSPNLLHLEAFVSNRSCKNYTWSLFNVTGGPRVELTHLVILGEKKTRKKCFVKHHDVMELNLVESRRDGTGRLFFRSMRQVGICYVYVRIDSALSTLFAYFFETAFSW